MSWIKRNLYFLIGGVVAVVLLAIAGWYLYSNWQLNNQRLEELNKAYADLERIIRERPNPGSPDNPGKVDNVKNAEEQRAQVLANIQELSKYFSPAQPIPDTSQIGDSQFSAELARTVDQLRRDAANASVGLPKQYDFSFEGERQVAMFAAGSLPRLAAQLGEIRAICDVLFAAKINFLDNLQRERVSADDAKGLPASLLDESSVTNDLAVLTPYQVRFFCFSSDLAAVLAGFANSPHGIIVKTINVEQSPPAAPAPAPMVTMPVPTMTMPVPTMTMPAPTQGMGPEERAAWERRYGGGGGMAAPPPVVYALPPPPAPSGRGGLKPVLTEQRLKVTLMLNFVKLLPKK